MFKGIGILLAIGLVLGGMFMLSTTYVVDQSEVAVLTTNGKVTEVQGPGRQWKTPFFQSYTTYSTAIQNLQPKDRVNTYTIDNQEVDVLFNVFYRIPAEKAPYIYANVPDYSVRLFSMTIDRIKAEMGKVNVEHVAEQRGLLRDRIKNVLEADAKSLGLEVTDFQLSDIQYTDAFRNAVNAAAVSKAGVNQREYEKQQAQQVAEKAKIVAEGEANAAIETARGRANATLVQAQAEAQAIQLRGNAEATAIKAQSDALGQNPKLVDLRKAERWDGKLPVNMYGSQPVPFLNLQN